MLQWRLYMGYTVPVDQQLVIKPLHCNSALSTGPGHTAALCGVWPVTPLGHVGLNMDKTKEISAHQQHSGGEHQILTTLYVSRLEMPSESDEVRGVITGTKGVMSTVLQFCTGFLKEVCVCARARCVFYISTVIAELRADQMTFHSFT